MKSECQVKGAMGFKGRYLGVVVGENELICYEAFSLCLHFDYQGVHSVLSSLLLTNAFCNRFWSFVSLCLLLLNLYHLCTSSLRS